MTLNDKVGGFMDFFGDFGLRHKAISCTWWRYGAIVMWSR